MLINKIKLKATGKAWKKVFANLHDEKVEDNAVYEFIVERISLRELIRVWCHLKFPSKKPICNWKFEELY